MRISDWSSDVCSSDLLGVLGEYGIGAQEAGRAVGGVVDAGVAQARARCQVQRQRRRVEVAVRAVGEVVFGEDQRGAFAHVDGVAQVPGAVEIGRAHV